MDIKSKSTRHSKICGDFGEALILYWLSKARFECATVDHTGIDIIAQSIDDTNEVWGISVKSRTRYKGTERESVSISYDNFTKAQAACDFFQCKPYFAIVVDGGDQIIALLMTMEHFMSLMNRGVSSAFWPMSRKALASYKDDPNVRMIIINNDSQVKDKWWKTCTDQMRDNSTVEA